MDSGNSGSLQSSSGDEEYDSRADAISTLMNNPGGAAHVGHISSQPPPPPQRTTNSSSMFDPLSNYFDHPMSRPPPQQQPLQNPSSLLNLDMAWSKTLRSEPNCTEILSPMLSTSSIFASQVQVQPHGAPENTSATNTPRGAVAAAASSDQTTHVVRNPKKRSRASRRAPTTVLTTDTTNFRAMVQEFTGIPAPPFTSSSFPRSRFDLYGTPSSMRSTTTNPLDNSQPPYLRRPFPQKVQLPTPFLTSSSSSFFSSTVVDHAIASSNTNNIITSGSLTHTSPNATPSLNYHQLSSELGLLKQQPTAQSSSLFNMPNPILASLLQSNTAKFAPPNSSLICQKTTQGSLDIASDESHLKMGVLEEFGLSHGQATQVNATTLSGLPGHISSDQTGSRNNKHPPLSWGNGVGGSTSHDDDQCQVRLSANGGNFNFARNPTNGKINYSSANSSSSFHGDKGSDNVAAVAPRGEVMMESWICSSD